jgi:hypothetical protein
MYCPDGPGNPDNTKPFGSDRVFALAALLVVLITPAGISRERTTSMH